ncbi:hypothetical protein DRO91_01400 [Candidatus Heimdallarchaeota archaeon]|nr:MAG: hypothetical protein DRP02_06475 [Candidatus Gerdarchaeota archaeon]RLI74091.1 MAG: hypothetical protein DRO91_01400 [Candidatus Heimdallarchaeota archaeon]
MLRSITIQLKATPLLADLTIRAKNLYNVATYQMRQRFFQRKRLYTYTALWKELKEHKAYLALKELAGAQSPQQILRLVRSTWTGYLAAKRAYRLHPANFHAPPKPPKYVKKHRKFVVLWSHQEVRIRNGKLLLPRKVMTKGFPAIPLDRLPCTAQTYRTALLVPFYDRYQFIITYEAAATAPAIEKDAPEKVLGVDLGVNNLVATSDGLLIKGKIIKSINHYYNKQRAKLCSVLARHKLPTSRRLQRLLRLRQTKIHDYLHKASRQLIQHCREQQITTIVIGRNKHWKQKVRLGKKTNQHFVGIPFHKFIRMLTYKAAAAGINVQLVSEAYTSQTCSRCGHRSRSNRVFRGLFLCNHCALVCNADVNAAINIAQKVRSRAAATTGSTPRRGARGTVPVPVPSDTNLS